VNTEDPISPILLNPFKHHIGFIRNYIRGYNNLNYDKLKLDLLKIGGSQMDIYLGNLSIDKISTEIISHLNRLKLLEKESFFPFVRENGGYRRLTLSDDSEWIVRKGNDSIRYVHVHPGRYSRRTLRVKATTLKCAIAAQIMYRYSNQIDLKRINKTRINVLKLSPIKRMDSKSGIGRILAIIQN